MDYIKTFEDLNFDRDIKAHYTIVKNVPGMVEYAFRYLGKAFLVRFTRELRAKYISETEPGKEIIMWKRDYGLRLSCNSISIVELNLLPKQLLDLIAIITDITLDFIKRKDPQILAINHDNMGQEEVGHSSMNKRSKINYQFLKNKVPNGYNLSYYAAGNEHFSNVTICYIYKEGEEIEYLNKFNKKLI
jgi:hypothetical protein